MDKETVRPGKICNPQEALVAILQAFISGTAQINSDTPPWVNQMLRFHPGDLSIKTILACMRAGGTTHPDPTITI